jgi:hypothetical protein
MIETKIHTIINEIKCMEYLQIISIPIVQVTLLHKTRLIGT